MSTTSELRDLFFKGDVKLQQSLALQTGKQDITSTGVFTSGRSNTKYSIGLHKDRAGIETLQVNDSKAVSLGDLRKDFGNQEGFRTIVETLHAPITEAITVEQGLRVVAEDDTKTIVPTTLKTESGEGTTVISATIDHGNRATMVTLNGKIGSAERTISIGNCKPIPLSSINDESWKKPLSNLVTFIDSAIIAH